MIELFQKQWIKWYIFRFSKTFPCLSGRHLIYHCNFPKALPRMTRDAFDESEDTDDG